MVSAGLQTLWNNYPSRGDLDHDELFDYLGWGDLKDDRTYENTCAIRLSLCLIKSGVLVPGRMKIKKGPFKGRMIEPGQVRLSNLLISPQLFGAPQKFKRSDRDRVIADQQGIISFMRIPAYIIDGALSGHIDLVRHGKFLYLWDTLDCREDCYWHSQEFWFWPLK